jgi:LysM repeat protein
MTERGLPSTDGAPACPFVAFGDDRDGRSTSPDHRHRCFAESPPAPRAVAHQEAYCLSSAFPVCPTFQDWARREAAHTRGVGERPETAPTAVPSPGPIDAVDDIVDDGLPRPGPDDPPVHRNPPRDWAAPPPWATGSAGAGRTTAPGAGDAAAADLLAGRAVEGQGLAGSAADRLAGGPGPEAGMVAAAWSASGAGAAASSADDDLAGLVQGRPAASPPRSDGYPPPSRPPVRQPVPTRPTGDAIPGPAWEGMRRYEAYPTIKARAGLPGLPGLPRLAVLAVAIAIAALALFMLPALLGIGGPPSGSSAPSRSPGVVPSASPTVKPAPTPQIYIVKTGDTMSKIAKKLGVTLDDLLAANKATIPNPDKIKVGDQVIIPSAQAAPTAAPVTSPSAKASAKAP